MAFLMKDGITQISLNPTMTLALAAVLLLLGYWVKSKIRILDKFCIPSPVIGGFIFMFVTWIGYFTGSFAVNFENIFQETFMLAFFTTVGLGASLALLKKSGKLLIICLLMSGLLATIQNTIGIILSKTSHIEAPYALLSSAISMVGGHGAALSYGNTFKNMGYEQAPPVGAAAATFGLITAVLLEALWEEPSLQDIT